MGQRVAIFGSGGFAKEIAEVLRSNGDDVAGCYARSAGQFPAIYRGDRNELEREAAEYDSVALAVGAVNRRTLDARRELVEWLSTLGPAPARLVSPKAIVSEEAIVEDGAFVGHGVVIAVNAVVRSHAIVNIGAIIGHDALISERAIVAPGAFVGGESCVGSDTIIGPLAKVLQGISIGENVILGIGCNALRSLNSGATVWPHPSTPVST